MQLLRLSAALSAVAACLLPGFYASVNAQEAEFTCFMTTQSGQVIDLSQSVCGSNQSIAPPLAATDTKFIAAYKRQVMQYPDVRDNLLASAKESPEPSIGQAKSVCDNLRSGLSLQDIEQNQANEMLEREEAVSANIINTLAPKYYCPEINGR